MQPTGQRRFVAVSATRQNNKHTQEHAKSYFFHINPLSISHRQQRTASPVGNGRAWKPYRYEIAASLCVIFYNQTISADTNLIRFDPLLIIIPAWKSRRTVPLLLLIK
jgi:hypothetical protein